MPTTRTTSTGNRILRTSANEAAPVTLAPDEPQRAALPTAEPEQPTDPAGDEGPGDGRAPLVSRQTLEQTPSRALQFLRGVGTSVTIRTRLAARGYTEEEHARGWALLQSVSGYFGGSSASGDTAEAADALVRKAIADVDAWDESGFRVVNASLRVRHPAQHAFVMKGLKAATGAEAVVGVSALLDRIDALEKGEGRPDTREGDLAAVATLAARGIDARERARLRALGKQAQAFVVSGRGVPGEQERLERRVKPALGELRGWYEEWAEIARATFKRRDQLIRLGLASRRTRRDSEEEPAGEEPIAEGAAI